MTKNEAEKAIQEKLSEARRLLNEAGEIADENFNQGIEFMGLTFEPHFGWFNGSDLQEPSEWNVSECVIGSKMAMYGSMEWNPSQGCG